MTHRLKEKAALPQGAASLRLRAFA